MFTKNWRQAWRWWSMRASALGAAATATALAAPEMLHAAWIGLPPEIRATLPDQLGIKVSLILFLATIVGRLVKQPEASDDR